MSEELRLRVDRIIQEADGIRTFEFVDPQRGSLPPFTAGAHIDVLLPDGHLRQYSLCNDPSETHRYVVAVLRDANGMGGSAAMHDKVHESDAVVVSVLRNHFPLHEEAERPLLIAGGIGITPMLAMAQRLSAIGTGCFTARAARSGRRSRPGLPTSPSPGTPVSTTTAATHPMGWISGPCWPNRNRAPTFIVAGRPACCAP